MLELLVILAGCALVAIVVWPAFGAYLILSASPLIVGMARGSIPLRPNEMLLLLVMTALGIRTVLLMLSGRRHPPRVPAPESWRDFVYIESGYIWLLWIGGVPFLIAFAYFAYVSLGTLRQVALTRTDAIAAAAAAGFCYLSAMLALMLFDPQLTLRGSADLFFPLLALSLASSLGPLRQYTPQLPLFIASRRPSTGYPSRKEGIIAATD